MTVICQKWPFSSKNGYLFGFFSSLDRWFFFIEPNIGPKNHKGTHVLKNKNSDTSQPNGPAHFWFLSLWLNFDYICSYFSILNFKFFVKIEKNGVFTTFFLYSEIIGGRSVGCFTKLSTEYYHLEHTVSDFTGIFFFA